MNLMTDDQRQRLLALYLSAKKAAATALLVDYDEMLRVVLAEAGATVGVRQKSILGRDYDAADMWFGIPPASQRLVVLHRKKSPKELFRDVSICGSIVASGGVLALACPSDAFVDHSYQEATEIFISVEPGWTRTLHQKSNVIELRRT